MLLFFSSKKHPTDSIYMSNTEDLKKQRERFLSFSFATSDLLLEVNDEGRVQFALGAIKGLTGNKNAKALIKTDWLDLFSPKDRMVLKIMLKKAQPGLRCGPTLVSIKKGKTVQNILVSAIKMPDKSETFISIATGSALMNQIGQLVRDYEERKPLDKETFIDAAQEVLRMASDLGQDVDMTLIDLPNADKAKKRYGKEAWDKLSEDVDKILCQNSIDGGTAAHLGGGRYSVIHDSDTDISALTTEISKATKEHDPFGEGLEIQTKSISTDMSSMDERDATRALFYTLNEFERQGTEMTIDTLNSSFKAFVAANTQKIQEFKNILQSLSFSMHFQPIVNLQTQECSHYEMLCRFKEGNTFEWIMFGEDIGMASELDIAVCRRALNYITKKRMDTDESFSINLSGQSMTDESFLQRFEEEIKGHEEIKHRLIFEITESTQIKDLDQVGEVVKRLRSSGLKIALDDFGAGSASFQYLSSMHVDFVKIDGKYIKNIMNDKRDMIMVKNLTQMCKDLDMKVVGEFVENKEIANALHNLGIDYGQGYYFGKPAAGPHYTNPEEQQKS